MRICDRLFHRNIGVSINYNNLYHLTFGCCRMRQLVRRYSNESL